MRHPSTAPCRSPSPIRPRPWSRSVRRPSVRWPPPEPMEEVSMALDQPRRVRLLVLGHVGAGIVFEKHDDGDRVPVHIADGPETARSWVDNHYEEVDWESPHRAVASTASPTERASLSPTPAGTRAWEHRPL